MTALSTIMGLLPVALGGYRVVAQVLGIGAGGELARTARNRGGRRHVLLDHLHGVRGSGDLPRRRGNARARRQAPRGARRSRAAPRRRAGRLRVGLAPSRAPGPGTGPHRISSRLELRAPRVARQSPRCGTERCSLRSAAPRRDPGRGGGVLPTADRRALARSAAPRARGLAPRRAPRRGDDPRRGLRPGRARLDREPVRKLAGGGGGIGADRRALVDHAPHTVPSAPGAPGVCDRLVDGLRPGARDPAGRLPLGRDGVHGPGAGCARLRRRPSSRS